MTADGFLNGLSGDFRAAREDEQLRQARSDRLAVSLLRRSLLRHNPGCTGKCRHRNHARDQEHLMLLLDILDLDGTPAHQDDYQEKLTWHSVSRSEMALMQGKAA